MSNKDIDPSEPTLDALHDAVLKGSVIDYVTRTVTIDIEFYVSKDDRDRRPGKIIFDGVESVSQVTNLIALEMHESAGNVVQWVPGDADGTTYIDVIGGSFAISARRVRLKLDTPHPS